MADPQAALPAHEGEIIAEFAKELLQMDRECFFEVGFRVFVFEAEELQNVGVFEFGFGRSFIVSDGARAFAQHRRFVPRESRSLVKLRSDLAVELTPRPSSAHGFRLIEAARMSVFDGQQARVV